MDIWEKTTAYARTIRTAYPALPLQDLRLVTGEGQNNDIVIADDTFVFRFPRHAHGVRRLPAVVHVLRAVGRHVALPVPDPQFFHADAPVGQAFLGYPLLGGKPLWQETIAAMSEPLQRRLAEQLTAFLRQLHAVPLTAVVPATGEVFRPLDTWEDLYRRIRAQLYPAMRPDACTAVTAHFESFLHDPRNRTIPPVLMHGDYGTGNVLYDPVQVEITGVVDFDGAGPGDAAVDLAALLSGPPAFQEHIRSAYPVTEELARRVQFYRGTFALQEALHGVEHDDPEAFASGIGSYR